MRKRIIIPVVTIAILFSACKTSVEKVKEVMHEKHAEYLHSGSFLIVSSGPLLCAREDVKYWYPSNIRTEKRLEDNLTYGAKGVKLLRSRANLIAGNSASETVKEKAELLISKCFDFTGQLKEALDSVVINSLKAMKDNSYDRIEAIRTEGFAPFLDNDGKVPFPPEIKTAKDELIVALENYKSVFAQAHKDYVSACQKSAGVDELSDEEYAALLDYAYALTRDRMQQIYDKEKNFFGYGSLETDCFPALVEHYATP